MSQPWEQWERETPKAFAAFCSYRDLGSQRSHEKVREKSGKSPGYERVIRRWSSRYDWVNRVTAWDNRLQEKVRVATEDALVAIEKRLIEAAYDRILAEVENGAGDWRAALEVLKRRRRDEWGDNVSVRADKRASELIAALLGEEAAGDPAATGNREG